jgi:uncharacterized protein
MGKLIFWLVVAFAIMFGLRLVGAAKARARRRDAAGPRRNGGQIESMVRCERCGIYLPRSDATAVAGGYRCADETGCGQRR